MRAAGHGFPVSFSFYDYLPDERQAQTGKTKFPRRLLGVADRLRQFEYHRDRDREKETHQSHEVIARWREVRSRPAVTKLDGLGPRKCCSHGAMPEVEWSPGLTRVVTLNEEIRGTGDRSTNSKHGFALRWRSKGLGWKKTRQRKMFGSWNPV